SLIDWLSANASADPLGKADSVTPACVIREFAVLMRNGVGKPRTAAMKLRRINESASLRNPMADLTVCNSLLIVFASTWWWWWDMVSSVARARNQNGRARSMLMQTWPRAQESPHFCNWYITPGGPAL